MGEDVCDSPLRMLAGQSALSGQSALIGQSVRKFSLTNHLKEQLERTHEESERSKLRYNCFCFPRGLYFSHSLPPW